MVNRDTAWPEGTPCWVDLAVPDIKKAISFYTGLFGWDIEEGGPEVGGYSSARIGGRYAAGLGPKMGGGEQPTMWTTYLAVEDADATAAKIRGAGGQLIVDPMDVMDLGRMAVAMDATGGAFGLWQARSMVGAEVVNAAGALTWNEQMSHDFEAAKKFYGAVFGYEFGDMSTPDFTYATLNLSGQPVGGIGAYPPGVPQGLPGSWAVYFGVADTDAAAAKATELGGTTEHQPTDTPYGRMAIVTDDQGARMSLMSVRAQ